MKRKILFISLSLALAAGAASVSYSDRVSSELSQNVVRLHILANSDSEEDQSLKIAVRDRILKEGRALFEGSASKAETERILRENIDFLTEAASDEIAKNGYSYPVKINVGRYGFPMKRYESFVFPAGEYDAVRVEIGEASGKNWWCVMFPPLCFVDAAVSGEGAGYEALRQSLSPGELDIITPDNGIDIRFKVADLVQSSIYSVKTALKK